MATLLDSTVLDSYYTTLSYISAPWINCFSPSGMLIPEFFFRKTPTGPIRIS